MTVRDSSYLILIVAYTFLFVVGHELVSQIYGKLIFGLDRKSVEFVLAWGSLLSGGGVFVWLLNRVGGSFFFWCEGVLLGALLWVSTTMLICTNVECIHYLQYAILGFFVRTLIAGDILALLACNLVGMMDEFIQYVLNPHYTQYLDFNDMILNMLGALVGISLWNLVRGRRSNPFLVAFWKKVIVVCYALVITVCIWGFVSGRVVSYWQSVETPFTSIQQFGETVVFVLSYVNTSSFYLTTSLGRKYHVMDIQEWAWVSLALLGFAFGLSRCRKYVDARG